MNPTQVSTVQKSFALVAPISDKAGLIFYDRLFEMDPALRPLFKGSIAEQSKKLMQMLATVVSSLNELDRLLPAVYALGARHKKYGVKDEHYQIVAEALLWTLKQGLADAYTPEVEGAWVAAYTVLATAMKSDAATSPRQA